MTHGFRALIHGWLTLFFWVQGEAEYLGGSSWWRRTAHLMATRKKKEKVTIGKVNSSKACPTLTHFLQSCPICPQLPTSQSIQPQMDWLGYSSHNIIISPLIISASTQELLGDNSYPKHYRKRERLVSFSSILEEMFKDTIAHRRQMHPKSLLLLVHNCLFFFILCEANWCLHLCAMFRCLWERKGFNILGSVLFVTS